MKILLTATTILLMQLCCAAQYNALQLCNEHTKLNGGIRSQFGGISRTFIPLQLPSGTTHIVFSITLAETNNINEYSLTTSLIGAFATGNIISAMDAVNSLSGEPGTGIIDFWLMDNRQCANEYVNKVAISCQPLYGRNNTAGGIYTYTVTNSDAQRYWLCLRNPSEANAVYFHIEATAITTSHTDNTNQPAGGDNSPNYLKIKYSKPK